MIRHSLVCLVQGSSEYSFKALRLRSEPTDDKIQLIYSTNIETLKKLIVFCKSNSISSLRVTSSLFPLASHKNYRDKGLKYIEEALKIFKDVDLQGIELSVHPDQFILLSSVNSEVNAQSRYDLELVAHIAKSIPLKLMNIHVGSKAQGADVHRKIFAKEVSLLSSEAKKLLSIENDEKSYDFLTTLNIAQENGLMIVPDFHHERCYQRRNLLYQNISHEGMDNAIYSKIPEILQCYERKLALPTFHISSPSCGWNEKFKDECSHSDYIATEDYPVRLAEFSELYKKDFILDVEAKHKQLAIFKLEDRLAA